MSPLFSFVSAFSHFSDLTYSLAKVFPQARGRLRTWAGKDHRVLLCFKIVVEYIRDQPQLTTQNMNLQEIYCLSNMKVLCHYYLNSKPQIVYQMGMSLVQYTYPTCQLSKEQRSLASELCDFGSRKQNITSP